MRNIFLTVATLATSTLFAQNGKLNPASTSTKWLKNIQTDFIYSHPDSASFAPERNAGKNWFFEYVHKAAEYEGMSDDEMTEIIGFQMMPVKGTSFKFSGKQLTQAKAYYMLGCFCKDRGFKLIHEGTIIGKKVSSSVWNISIDVTIKTGDGQIHKKVKGNYSLKKD